MAHKDNSCTTFINDLSDRLSWQIIGVAIKEIDEWIDSMTADLTGKIKEEKIKEEKLPWHKKWYKKGGLHPADYMLEEMTHKTESFIKYFQSKRLKELIADEVENAAKDIENAIKLGDIISEANSVKEMAAATHTDQPNKPENTVEIWDIEIAKHLESIAKKFPRRPPPLFGPLVLMLVWSKPFELSEFFEHERAIRYITQVMDSAKALIRENITGINVQEKIRESIKEALNDKLNSII